jgi:predicted permease
VSLATGIIAGILPSLAKQQLVTALKEGGKSSYSTRGGPVRSGLLIAQFSLSLTLLVAAAMAIKSLQEIREVDPGYITSNVKAIQLDLNWTTYGDNASRWQVTQSIMNALENLNEVSKAAAAFTYPMDTVMAGFGQIRQSISLDDRPFNPNDILSNTYSRSVSYNYFDVLGIQLKQGRPFSRHDTADDLRVIIINQSLAKQYWPDESAVNHKVSFDNGASWNTIVGVVDDVLEQGLNVDATNQIYRPMAQSPSLHVALLVKTTEDKTGANVNAGVSHADLTLNRRFQDNVREIIRLEDVQQAISKIESLQQALVNSMSLQTFIAQVLTVFAGIAMFITVSGISGVLGYMVSVRTREIGIRMAIGANQRDVLLMILLYGLKLSVTGLALGIVGAWWIAEQLNEHLYNVSSHDVGIYIISLTIMLAVTIGASLLPSYQASTMNPNRALKAT